MSVAVGVTSEIGPLELVVTSRPGAEFEHMVPENLERYRPGPDGRPAANPDYLLFDDLVLLSALKREHATLVSILTAVTGSAGHVDFRWLLASALGADAARREVIDGTLALESALYGVDEASRKAARGVLESLDATRLADALISGAVPHGPARLLRWPAPNTLFARDLAATVGGAYVLTYAAEPARRRDMLLMRAVLRHHPLLCDVPRADIGEHPGATLEGGDIHVVDERCVLIGVGLRTTMAAVRRLAPLLFARGVEVLLACQMPRRRAAMHIDTLFTRVDPDRCLIFPPLVETPEDIGIRITRLTPAGEADAGCDLLAALRADGAPLTPIYCGGNDPIAWSREQWSDGANAFAVAPGVIVCYGRNEHTLRALSAAGYGIVEPDVFIANAPLYVGGGRGPVAVTLRGHELVRGRGGPRCLTLPMRRA